MCRSHTGKAAVGNALKNRQKLIKIAKTVFSIAICRQLGDKWQSKTLFVAMFGLRSSIVLTFLIAVYLMWIQGIAILRKSII